MHLLDGGVAGINALHGVLGNGLQQIVQLLILSGCVAFDTAQKLKWSILESY